MGILKVSIAVKAIGQGVESEKLNFDTLKADHIIVDRTWYPFARGAVQEISDLLDASGLKLGDTSVLADYLAAKQLAAETLWFGIRARSLGQPRSFGFPRRIFRPNLLLNSTITKKAAWLG